MSDTIRYRIIERVGTDEDYHWMETDTGAFTRMPGEHGPDPTMADAQAYARKFNTATREIQFTDGGDDRA
jgi:hypothetical protein